MGRLLTYLFITAASAFFWAGELWLNYLDYTAKSPLDLDERYQRVFLVSRDPLLLAELGLPLLMTVAFIALLVVKFAAKSVRLALGFLLLMSSQFWAWRAFVFDGRMATIFLRNENEDPTLTMPNDFKWYMCAFAAALVVVIFLREYPIGQDQDLLHARLRRSLKKSNL
jgi:glucan phosphoethanolaminetransferase (alkaline phosphatase superfamily)